MAKKNSDLHSILIRATNELKTEPIHYNCQVLYGIIDICQQQKKAVRIMKCVV